MLFKNYDYLYISGKEGYSKMRDLLENKGTVVVYQINYNPPINVEGIPEPVDSMFACVTQDTQIKNKVSC